MPEQTQKGLLLRGQDGEELVAYQSHEGLIPHPDELSGYEEIVPGSAKVIMDMVVAQQEHRMSVEDRVVDAYAKEVISRSHAQYVVMGVVMLCTAAMVALAFLHPSWTVAVGAPAILYVASVAIRAVRGTHEEGHEDSDDEDSDN